MDAPTPHTPPRLGPRPLPLHLATEGWLLQMSFAGLMPGLAPSSSASVLSKPVQRLAAEYVHQNPEGFAAPWQSVIAPAPFVDALTREAKTRMEQLVQGIARYQTHAFHRTRTAPPPVWASGAASLRDYGGPAKGPAVVVVPSLINCGYILDLSDDRSLLAATAAAGVRAFLLDWGEPGADELNFTIDDYILRVMIPALEHVKKITGSSSRLAGYCMGGTLTAAVAALRPDLISGLALLAAPWNFHAESAASRAFITNFRPMIDAMISTTGCASVDFLQAMFASLDPTLVGRKFRGFAARDVSSDAARRFVELEDWLNDGIPLAGPVAMQCLFGWYGENQTFENKWAVNGIVIDPQKISTPALVMIPSHDRIVPPESAKALASRIPNCKTLNVDLGHIGMMAGGCAPKLVYEPFAQWLKSL
ncbi:MAG: alpha/beta fold hydrolase [Rhodospirillaceae bacterium]|nr:alpha/beta fold hydrolase [Rhodospirillaceae bacterium]